MREMSRSAMRETVIMMDSIAEIQVEEAIRVHGCIWKLSLDRRDVATPQHDTPDRLRCLSRCADLLLRSRHVSCISTRR